MVFKGLTRAAQETESWVSQTSVLIRPVVHSSCRVCLM